jgi:hypothetical protein
LVVFRSATMAAAMVVVAFSPLQSPAGVFTGG